MTCLMEAEVTPLVATLSIDQDTRVHNRVTSFLQMIGCSFRWILYAGFVVGAYWSDSNPPTTYILSLLGQCVSLISLVLNDDAANLRFMLIMTTCSTITGLGYQSVRLSFPLYGASRSMRASAHAERRALMPSLP